MMPQNDHPNLLIVFPDQMRGQAMGFLGKEPVITPYLDQFAQEGIVLPNAISNTPVCSPFRGMFLTGMYPLSNGVTNNCNSEAFKHNIELKKDSICWSDILNDQGYETGYIGKWHLDSPHEPYIQCLNDENEIKWNEFTPPERRHGFNFWYSHGSYNQHLNPLYWSTEAKRDQFHYIDQWGPEHEADVAITFLKNEGGKIRDPKKPFALVVSMNPPHPPYDQVPDKYIRLYKDRQNDIDLLCNQPCVPENDTKYGQYFRKNIKLQLSMITGCDEQFGRILAALKDADLKDNTIVVFTSDHGDCLGKHGMMAKSNPFEESLCIPFIIRWPGKIIPRVDDLLISVPDFYPTLLSLLGFENSVTPKIEGTDYSSVIRNGSGSRPLYQFYLVQNSHLCAHPNQSMINFNPLIGERGIRTARFTFVVCRDQSMNQSEFLWDRESDPFQLHNLAQENSGIVNHLYKDNLIPWLIRTKDPWIENPATK